MAGVGFFATAAGALAGGGTTELLQEAGMLPLNSYRTIVILYGAIGLNGAAGKVGQAGSAKQDETP